MNEILNDFKNLKNKKAVCSLSLTLLLVMTLMIAFAQTAQPAWGQAGIPQPEKTAGYISVSPPLIGVGQKATVNLWVFPLPTTYGGSPYYGGFNGVTVTFVRPDGTKDTFMPTDPAGAFVPGQTESMGTIFFTDWAPNMAGNWSVSFTMPAQNITDISGTVQYLGCTSNTATFTVQTEPVLAGLLNGYPWAQLPNSNVFWNYPINTNNREWYQISGDWTGVYNTAPTVVSSSASHWQRYGPGPNTGHIVWDQPSATGGIIGGDYGSISYSFGSAYFTVIMDGKVFMNIPNTQQFQCIELATGTVLYKANGAITNGIHLPGNAYAQAFFDPSVVLASSMGASPSPYLFGTSGTTWNYYTPSTGALARQISNASSARLVDGTVLGFGTGTITGQNGSYLYRWNMTKVTGNNWPTGVEWKVTLPTLLASSPSFVGGKPSIFAVSSDASTVVIGALNQYWGYNADTGAQLWNITLTYPVTANEQIPLANVDKFYVFDSVAATFHMYSIKTGEELWETPSFASSPWATTYTVYTSQTNDLNNLYISFPDGAVRAYSLTDGHLIWTSTPITSNEYANNALPFTLGGMVMIGGNIYVYGGYTTYYQLNPVPRFNTMICINATTGGTVFTLNGGIPPYAAANGYVVGQSINDGNLYCIGKGQTTTSVTAQQQVGGSVLIQGSVLDQSEAQPNTAAISDADMSVWMDYMHMQNSTLLNNPPQCTGVPVTLTAVDPNGNTITIGTTTSNYQGNYGLQWTPETPGLYTIYADFAGTNSYFKSSASTYATVNIESSNPAPSTSTLANPPYEMYTIGMGIAVIIALAVAVLLIRKKP